MLLLAIDRTSKAPVWKQICERVVRLADEGSLAPGSRLPATRVLADDLGVDRSTVYKAYQELWALGYVESRPGSYSTIRARPKVISPGDRQLPGAIDWREVSSPAALRAHEDWRELQARTLPPAAGLIDFTTLAADRTLCPVDEFKRAVKGVLAEHGARVLDYGDPAGYPPLRSTLARRMRLHGVNVSADDILITSGGQQALELVLKLVARPGASVAIESPTYGLAIPLFRLFGLSIREIPMRSDGPDLDVLEQTFRRDRPVVFYTVPNFQNPTGITTSQAHRERLLSLCETHRVPILEDGFEEEMKYFGKAVLPIKSMDARGVVIYVGTFSKVIFPGLRIGWIAADRNAIERLLAISRFCSLSGNMLSQAAIARFCETGAFEAYLRRLHTAYRRRMQAVLRGLRQHMPRRGVSWTEPAGGYTLWVRLEQGSPDQEQSLVEHLRREGIRVAPGSLFFPSTPDGLSFRLSIANVRDYQIDEGCRRLGRALSQFIGG